VDRGPEKEGLLPEKEGRLGGRCREGTIKKERRRAALIGEAGGDKKTKKKKKKKSC